MSDTVLVGFARNGCLAQERIETRLELYKSARLADACRAWVAFIVGKTACFHVFAKISAAR